MEEEKSIEIRSVTASEIRRDHAELQSSNALADVAGSILESSRSRLEYRTIASNSLVCEVFRSDPMKSSVPLIRSMNMGASTSKSKHAISDR